MATPTSGEGSPLGKPVRDSNEAQPLDLLERAKVSIHARAQHTRAEGSMGIRKSSNRPQSGDLRVGCGNWLGGRDSNPDNVVQSHVSYR